MTGGGNKLMLLAMAKGGVIASPSAEGRGNLGGRALLEIASSLTLLTMTGGKQADAPRNDMGRI